MRNRPLFFVVDLTNLLREDAPRFTDAYGEHSRDVDLDRYDLILATIQSRWPGSIVKCVADDVGLHDEFLGGEADRQRYKRLLQGVVQHVPYADPVCLMLAQDYGGYILTRDNYAPHAAEYPDIVPSRILECTTIGRSRFVIKAPDDLAPIAAEHDPVPVFGPKAESATHVTAYAPASSTAPAGPPWTPPPSTRLRRPSATSHGILLRPLFAIILLLLVFALFGSSAGWAVGIAAAVALVGAAIWFVYRFGLHIVGATAYVGLVVTTVWLFWWSRTMGGFVGGVSLLAAISGTALTGWLLWVMSRRDSNPRRIHWPSASGMALLVLAGIALATQLGAFRGPNGDLTLGTPATARPWVPGATEPSLVLPHDSPFLAAPVTPAKKTPGGSFLFETTTPYWTSTDVVVAPGDELVIDATGQLQWDQTTPEPVVGPNGASWVPATVDKPEDFVLQDEPIVGLLARIGDHLFYVGEHARILSPTDGPLLFAINQRWLEWCWSGDVGTFTITVTKNGMPVGLDTASTSRVIVPAASEVPTLIGRLSDAGQMRFTATGRVVAVSNSGNGPDGDSSHRTSDLLVPGKAGGGLLIRIGESGGFKPIDELPLDGAWFVANGKSKQPVYAVINDAPGWYGDNSGSFEVSVLEPTP